MQGGEFAAEPGQRAVSAPFQLGPHRKSELEGELARLLAERLVVVAEVLGQAPREFT